MIFTWGTESPVCIEAIRMVRWLNDQIEGRLGAENRIQQEAIDAWARLFAERDVTLAEVETFASWHAQHYQEPPNIPILNRAVNHLREHGALPPYRLACDAELTAVALLKMLEQSGVSLHDARHTLSIAAGLAQAGYYRQHDRDFGHETDPVFIEHDLVGSTRFALIKARDAMPEIEQGVGQLADAREYLLGR